MTISARSDGERLYLVVLHLARRLRDFDVAAGISTSRFSALASLVFYGDMNVSQLAEFERVSRPAMTRLVRDLERDRFVRRRTDPQDGRGVVVSVTRRGHRLVEKCRNAKIGFVEGFLAEQSSETVAALRTVLAPLEGLAEKS